MQMYKPPPPRASPSPAPAYNHTGNSIVMDNLNSQLGYTNGNAYQPRTSPPSQVLSYFYAKNHKRLDTATTSSKASKGLDSRNEGWS